MSADDMVKIFLKIATFFFLIFIILASSGYASWRYTPEILVLVMFLVAYTVLLTLPIESFKLSPTSFEGKLARLIREKEDSPAPQETTEEVNEEVARFSQQLANPDTILMRLSIEIETTLRAIAEQAGMGMAKVGIGQLSRWLIRKEIIVEPWLIKALDFFRMNRNALIHEGKTTDVQTGVEIGREVLARLREIQKKQQNL